MSWSFLGNRAARQAVEPPPASPPKVFQAQQDTNNQTKGSLTDGEKWQRSQQRWNMDIKPADEAFTSRYNYFVAELRTRSPEAVIKTDFSKHEVRKFVNGYVDKKRFTAIHVQQMAEKDRYRALLESADYRDIEARSSPLALKLTMMYFGLPVAPMAFADPLQSAGHGPFGNLIFSSGLNDDQDDFEDEDLSFVPEELRPLRFLNYYDKRGHGKDNAHMNPEKVYELFYGLPMVVPTHEMMTRMRLRGAGVDDGLESEDTVKGSTGDGALEMVQGICLDPENTGKHRVSPHLVLHEGEEGASASEQVYLWGLSGRTVFSYFDAKSFFSAIDRVLGLNKRSDGATSVGITISLLSHPKSERGPCRVLASDQCFLGRCGEDEHNFYKTWLDTVHYFDDQIQDGDALDICVSRISQDVHFSETQADLAYRPSLQDDRIVSFSRSDDKDGALSYLDMSHSIHRETNATQYQAWFKSLWRTLSYPTEEQLKTYSIGSKEALPPQSCLVSISCAEASVDEEHHWFSSDVGPTSEAWGFFTHAYHIKGRREFILNSIPLTDPRASLISIPTEMASATADAAAHGAQETHERDRQLYWGSHSYTEDNIAFQETDWPGLQPVTGRPPPLNPLGRPANGVQLDDFAKGKAFREWSYAHPLSIHMQGQYPSIPINAPPLETVLKTPGVDGRPSDSFPVMSTQVLTPTEQRRLQETVFEMRSLALNRAQPCPFIPCSKHFAIDDAGRQHFRDHLQSAHIDKKCPLCDDKMFGYYDEQTKQQHFFENHAHYFSHRDDLHLNTVFDVTSMELTHERETKWNFCARCGRDHNQLNVNGDRTQHDNLCFPGVTDAEAQLRYCVDCGGSTNGAAKHVCTLNPSADPQNRPVHCRKCALPTHKLARSYAEKHLARCRGSHSDKTRWCPWCGQNLVIFSRTQSHKHLDECSYKPPTGEGPVNTTTGEASESPNDNRITRYWARQCRSARNEARNLIQIPKECLVKDCAKNLQELHADALLDHYSSETHARATDRLRFCPFCHMDFVQREWAEKHQKVDHFKDHVEGREVRITLDLEIAKATNKLDAVILEKLKLRNDDEFASKTTKDSQPAAEGQVPLSLRLEKTIESLLANQKKANQEADVRFDSLQTNLKTLMDALEHDFLQDRTAKRSYGPTSIADMSGVGSSKRQKTAKATEPINPRTPQQRSPSQDSRVTGTPSTGSSGAIMTPSDDTKPTGDRGSEPPSSGSSKTLGPLSSPQAPPLTHIASRTQGSNTPVAPDSFQQQVTESTPATGLPIDLGQKTPKSRRLAQSKGSGTRRRTRRAQIASSGRDEQAIAEGEDDDDEEFEEH